MPAPCGNWSVVAHTDEGVIAVPLRCRSWLCPLCAYRNRRKLIRALKDTGVDALLTLTCSPHRYRDPILAFNRLTIAIPVLIKRMRRYARNNPVEYFLVWETTKKGWPHAHLLIRSPFIPQHLLSKWWQDLTASSIVDIRRVHQAPQAAAYVAKYLTKQPHVPPGYRRWRTSLHFWQLPDPPSPRDRRVTLTWHLSQNPVSYLKQVYLALGWHVEERNDGSLVVTTRSPPQTGPPQPPQPTQLSLTPARPSPPC